jgi:hypothetical protein
VSIKEVWGWDGRDGGYFYIRKPWVVVAVAVMRSVALVAALHALAEVSILIFAGVYLACDLVFPLITSSYLLHRLPHVGQTLGALLASTLLLPLLILQIPMIPLLLLALSRLLNALSCALQRREYLWEGWRRREHEWDLVRYRIPLQEKDVGPDGKLLSIQVSPESHMVKQCLLHIQEHKLLAQIEKEVR